MLPSPPRPRRSLSAIVSIGYARSQGFPLAENPNEMTAIAALAAMAAGRMSCEALTRACLARIEARDSAVHAFAWLDPEQALREARLRDGARKAGAPGMLNGLPIG